MRVLAREAMAVACLVLNIEAPAQLLARRSVEVALGHSHRDLEGLAGVAQVSQALESDLVALSSEAASNDGGQLIVDAPCFLVRERIEPTQAGPALIELDVGKEQPERAEHAGSRRHDDAADAEIAGERGRMYAAQAAEGEHDEIARVASAVGGHGLHRPHHVGVGDEVDAVGRLDEIASEGRCNPVTDGITCGVVDQSARCRPRAPAG